MFLFSFSRQFRGIIIIIIFVISACSESTEPASSMVDLSDPWIEASPESQRVDGQLLQDAAANASNNQRIGSLLVVRGGRLIFEEYFNGNIRDSLNDVRSVTKSIVATLTSIALKEGFIGSLDETITDHLPAEQLPDDESKHSITIRHLLTMSSGLLWPELGGPAYNNWIVTEDHLNYVLSQPLDQPVGSTYNYNSGAVHLLGVVLEFATGMDLEDFADEYLFSKLGIDQRRWEQLSDGYVNGGAGLDLKPRDLARIGQLYLQNGKSGETQLLTEDWASISSEPAYSWRFVYGPATSVTYSHLWWIEYGMDAPAYFAWGYGGQYIFVIPELDMVVVSTSNWRLLSLEGGPEVQEQFGLDIIINQVIPAAEN